MPEIQEYLPQTSGQGPVGGTSPNLELGAAVGRGIEKVGAAIEAGGDLLHRRQAQEETADVYANFADKRASYTQQIQQQTQDGTLDVDKLAEQYDNDTSADADNLGTSEGKNYFNRQQARLRGHILQMATAGQTMVAANAAKGKFKQAVDANSNALGNDPTSFQDTYEQGVETVDQLIKTGGMPEKMREQAVNELGSEYSKAAIRGWANLDPDKAKHMLDQGAYDQFLSSDQKHQMYAEVSHYANAKTIEDSRASKAVQDAKDAQTDKWFNDNYSKIESGSLSTKEVLAAQKNGTIDWQDAERANRLIDASSKRDFKTDPRMKNMLANRITNPDAPNAINDDEDIDRYVGKGISISDANQLRTLLHRSPEQQAQQSGEKSLFKTIDSAARFKNMMTGQWDVLGEKNAAQAKLDYIQAKKDVKAAKGNVADLVNPNSPDYFGNRLQNYQTDPMTALSHQSQDRTNKALGLKSDEHDNPTPVKDARKPGESPASYLKRLGK